MSRNVFPLLIICGLNILIGSVVLRRHPAALPNRAFAFFAFSIGAWTLAIAATHNLPGPSIFFARTTFAAGAVMVFALLLLFRTFPSESRLEFSWTLALFGLSALLLAGLSFTALIVADAELKKSGLSIAYGQLHPIYGLYIYSCFLASVVVLVRKYWNSTGIVRLQFHYLFLGLLVPALGVTFTNLLIPLLLGTSRVGQYGPYFALIFLAFTAHALIHYRFMNIRLALRRGATFLLALAGSILILASALFILWALAPFEIQPTDVLLLMGSAIVVSVLLPVIRGLLSRLLDQYVYRADFNYQRTLHEASQALVGILDFDDLLDYTLLTTLRAVRSERAALYLLESGSLQLRREHSAESSVHGTLPASLPLHSPLVRFCATTLEPLVTEELPKRYQQQESTRLLLELRERRWGLVLPIHSESKLRGLVTVEPKPSGDPFFPDELQFVSILTNQAGIAISNAQLYKEVVLANEYIENILRTMDSGVITVDASGKVVLCNSTAERMTGVPKSVLTSLPITQLPSSLALELRATLADGQPRLQVETALHSEGDRLTPIVCSTSALIDKQGSILGALTVFSDLSKLKVLEAEKRRAERLASFGALASGIAHEIKNPLVAIKTFAELLPERFMDTDFREDFSKVVITEIDRIDGLVSRLRGIAAPTAHRVGPIDIRDPILDTLVLLRAQLEHSKIRVHREFEHASPYVAVDTGQLKQLFLNIFINAIEAMGSHGELTIRISRRDEGDTSWVRVAVSDTGPGIPDALKSHIFEPFFTTKPRGSGLGLAVCRGIADANRGTIRADSNGLHPGTTILVEFPREAPATHPTEQRTLLR